MPPLVKTKLIFNHCHLCSKQTFDIESVESNRSCENRLNKKKKKKGTTVSSNEMQRLAPNVNGKFK